jgi:alpha-glucosidase
MFYGPKVSTCVTTFAELIGRPAMVPKYALGYLASSMGYAESESAQELIEQFPDLCSKWDIPCDLLHLSSGYTGNGLHFKI